MKTYWASGGIAPCILDLDIRFRWSASRPGRFTSRQRAPCTHCIGGWVGPRTGLYAVVKRKIPSPHLKENCSLTNETEHMAILWDVTFLGSWLRSYTICSSMCIWTLWNRNRTWVGSVSGPEGGWIAVTLSARRTPFNSAGWMPQKVTSCTFTVISWGSSDSTVTRIRAGRPRFVPGKGWDILSSPPHPLSHDHSAWVVG
jgi:hypothetical protein